MATPNLASAVRGELLFAFLRQATWVVASIWVLQIIVFAYLVVSIMSTPSEFLTSDQSRAALDKLNPANTNFYPFASIPVYGGPVFIVLGALIGSSDFSRGTVHVVLSRLMVHEMFGFARIVALVVWAAVLSVLTFAAGLSSSLVLAAVEGEDPTFPALGQIALALLVGWLAISAYLLIGMMLGVLARNTLVAGGIGLVVTLGIETLLVSTLSPIIDGFEVVRALLPSGATSTVVVALAPENVAGTLLISAPSERPLAIGVLFVWAAAASIVTIIVLRRRDVG